MVTDIPQAIEFLSKHTTLRPGDIIATGTPEGVGPIADGDTVTCFIECVGTLANPVVRESHPCVMNRILVTGGGSGIGARVVAEYGDRCVVWSRRTGVDLTAEESVRSASVALLDSGGPPAALVHCVGDFEERPLLGADLPHYERMLHSNLTSAFLLTQHVVPAMRTAGRGRVIFFAAGGVESQTASARAPIYFAAKAALVAMAKSLAIEVAPAGLTVNVISPGIIRHETSHKESQDRMESRVPLGRAGTPDDVIGLVRLLLSDEGSYVTGTNLTVDGGLSL